MQNVYDVARELVHSLKECDQYKNYKAAKDKVEANEELKTMINDFTQKSMELQGKQMAGQQPEEDEIAKYSQLYAVVMGDPIAANYMNSQMALSQVVTEIYQMIGEALE